MNRIALIFLAIALAGCPSFDPADSYRCDTDSDCPEHRTCVVEQHLCKAPTTPPATDGGTSTPDGGTSTTDAGSDPGGCSTATHTVTFKAGPALDLLWIVDNSGSMQPYQEAIAQHAADIVATLDQHGVDYQLGVTSTDTADRGVFYPLSGERPRIVSPFSPDAARVFAQNATTGTQGSAEEMGLATAKLALTSPNVADPTKNGGFLRDEARLVVIFVSDEDDSSTGDVSDFATFFLGLHPGNSERVRAIAFTGPAPNGCNNGGLPAAAGERYLQLVSRVGGTSESICSPDWLKPLVQVADAAPVRNRFRLGVGSPVQVVSVVRVGTGTRGSSNNWTLDPQTNTLTVGSELTPARGESLEIAYKRSCSG